MKLEQSLKTLLLILIAYLSILACSNGQDNEEVDLSALCIEPVVLAELTEPIRAKVEVVEEGQPFFNGIKTYYEVDAETYLPQLFERNSEKIIRIFPLNNIKMKAGEFTEIKGILMSCVTGAHGLLTNDYKAFTLID